MPRRWLVLCGRIVSQAAQEVLRDLVRGSARPPGPLAAASSTRRRAVGSMSSSSVGRRAPASRSRSRAARWRVALRAKPRRRRSSLAALAQVSGNTQLKSLRPPDMFARSQSRVGRSPRREAADTVRTGRRLPPRSSLPWRHPAAPACGSCRGLRKLPQDADRDAVIVAEQTEKEVLGSDEVVPTLSASPSARSITFFARGVNGGLGRSERFPDQRYR